MTSTILITGASRGIGLCLTETYSRQGWDVIATCRQPKSAAKLQTLAERYSGVSIKQLDVTDLDNIRVLARELENTQIDVLMNNAAWLGEPEKQLIGNVDYDDFSVVMKTNTFAPVFLAECLLENVLRSKHKKIVTLTSGISSIAGTEAFGGLYFYRASKAATNIIMRALYADCRDRGLIVSVVAPGEVETSMLRESGYAGEAISASVAAETLYTYIEKLKPNRAEGFDIVPDVLTPW
jgi:NAD(P)-dependent dehydrogenase (short-subunit alcohol dehydrogenase family)